MENIVFKPIHKESVIGWEFKIGLWATIVLLAAIAVFPKYGFTEISFIVFIFEIFVGTLVLYPILKVIKKAQWDTNDSVIFGDGYIEKKQGKQDEKINFQDIKNFTVVKHPSGKILFFNIESGNGKTTLIAGMDDMDSILKLIKENISPLIVKEESFDGKYDIKQKLAPLALLFLVFFTYDLVRYTTSSQSTHAEIIRIFGVCIYFGIALYTLLKIRQPTLKYFDKSNWWSIAWTIFWILGGIALLLPR